MCLIITYKLKHSNLNLKIKHYDFIGFKEIYYRYLLKIHLHQNNKY